MKEQRIKKKVVKVEKGSKREGSRYVEVTSIEKSTPPIGDPKVAAIPNAEHAPSIIPFHLKKNNNKRGKE